MDRPAPTPSPPRRGLTPLALAIAVVLLAHGWVLQGPARTVAALEVPASPVSATAVPVVTFTTRNLAPPAPVSLPAATPAQAVAALAGPVTPRKFLPKRAPAPEDTAQAAIEKVAFLMPPAAESIQLAAAPQATGPAETGTPAPTPPTQKPVHYVVPPSVRLQYDVKARMSGLPLSASGELLWVQDGKSYEARLAFQVLMFGRVQTSKGQLTDQGLEPVRFGDKVRSEVAAHFERSKNKVSFSANTPDVPLQPGAQDQLSVFLQLAAMLGGAPDKFPAGTQIPFQAIGPKSAESWVFKVGTLEKLSLPGGEIRAIKLSRESTGEFVPSGEIWLAPDLNYLPVRIRLLQSNGDFVDQQWRATEKP